MKLVDAEDAVRFFEDIISNNPTLGTEIIFRINQMPEVNPWIPCEDRLPDTKGDFLVTYHPCTFGNVQDELLVGMDHFMGKTSWSRRKYQSVVAWKPLPKGWTGEEQ